VRKIKLLLFGVVLAALLALPGAAIAKSHDRDHDKMPDKWERHHGLSTHRANAAGDPDKDGLKNRGEYRSHTNPRDADSDDDGTEDGDEDRDRDGLGNRGEDDTGNDPTDRDTDDDGVIDGDEASGTIVSFTADPASAGSGVLVVRLADDSTVTGNVNGTTRIECETEDEREDGFDHHGGRRERDGADDNSGPGSGSDDGPDHDVNDDHGDDDGDRSNSGPGSGREHDGDEDDACTVADLTAGTRVHEAELHGTGADAVFEEIELLK
jgi:hypothetical protein